ncbi:hypothetical protein FRC14_002651 [Serendipita sp. 396]|nr:hypothetical protein FRC14_002651 [Serendipita sp. 396]KAG8784577.1 hypothetical protein FRC15_003028 [Serendipita sp. 397]KAG8800189.1 hypothetical protein FRC16_003438 [Serendipita sp. 398]KAG8868272.1 hypothetical protein FRC20_003703 [Serendipita sp. 405]
MGLITPLEDRSADIKDENIRDTTDQLQQHVASYSGIAKASLGIAKRSTRALDRIRVLEIDLRGNIPNISDEEIRDSFAVITNSMSVMCGQIQNLKQNVGDYRSNYIKIRNQFDEKSQYFAEQRQNEIDGKCRAEKNARTSTFVGNGVAECIRIGADVLRRESTILSTQPMWFALGMVIATKIAQVAFEGYYSEKAQESEKEIQRYNSLIDASNAIKVHLQAFEVHLDHIADGWAELESEWKLAMAHLELNESSTDKIDRKRVYLTMGEFHTKIERIYGSLMTYKRDMTSLVKHFSECDQKPEAIVVGDQPRIGGPL